MSFAKDQEEEVASVPGVAYTSGCTAIAADSSDDNGIADAGSRFDQGRQLARAARNPRAPSMDIEMAYLGGTRSGHLRGAAADTRKHGREG